MTYVAIIPKPSVERIFNSIFEELRNQGIFLDLVDDNDFKDRILDSVNEAIQDQKLSASALRDPNFTKGLVLAFATSYVMNKYNVPTLDPSDLSVLFMNPENDPEEYQEKLRELCREILVKRNELEPPEKQLTMEQIDKIVDKVMESPNPLLTFKLVLNDLVKEQQKQEEDPKAAKEDRAAEEMRLKNESSLFGITHIPGLLIFSAVQTLLLGNFQGFVNEGVALKPTSIMADQRVRDTTRPIDESQIKILQQEVQIGGAVDLDRLIALGDAAVKQEALSLKPHP